MRLACIEIGTNSTKLLVADVEDQEIATTVGYWTVITRIGQGVDKSHELLPEAMNRTLEVIEGYVREAERLEVQEIIPVATSAMRDARNRDVFIQKVEASTGLKLLVISGDEEARLTFVGACSDLKRRSEKMILVDVGGGSSEFIVGQNGQMEDSFSLDTGAVRLTETFIHSDPVDPEELQAVIEYVTSLLRDRLARISMEGRHVVGVGGTIASLAAILYQRMPMHVRDGIDQCFLRRDELAKLLRFLSQMKLDDRKKVPGLSPERADVIVAGAAIFSVIMEILAAEEIVVSDRGVRYGVLLSRASD